mmetsp:Transcript_3378/g.8741  ORF Transcript_3378/g.8741 Transcript_3378/m.8741 type:complete len:147 (-) Transcript_3378:1985-2425(-)
MPYGDQAMFISAARFKQVGGFPPWPFLEDLELCKRVWNHSWHSRQHALMTHFRDLCSTAGTLCNSLVKGVPPKQQIIPAATEPQLPCKLFFSPPIRIAHTSVTTAGRRWEKVGVVKTTLLNQFILLGFHLGVSVDTLSRVYRAALR